MTDVRVLHTGDADVIISKAIRNEGDRLVINGNDGADRIDASGLGGDGTPTACVARTGFRRRWSRPRARG